MGLTGVLRRTVFSRSRSFGAGHEQHHNGRGRGKRWSSSVRSYLCGDELFDSVLAEDDSASEKAFLSSGSSEATVRADEMGLPIDEDQTLNVDILRKEEEAAIRIQSAFRCYMARLGSAQAAVPEMSCNAEELFDGDKESPFDESESVCTSLEVQTANSVKISSVTRKAKEQPVKFKEDWDDSTVSSYISKMRVQNRLEAMTRRERALAYAFSQQLRICSTKKASSTSDDEETNNNMGWSWLERWMATRIPDKDVVVIYTSKLHGKKPISPANVNSFEISKEEKESCGSNEVFLQFTSSFSNKKRAMKPKRSVSKRKTVPSYVFAKET